MSFLLTMQSLILGKSKVVPSHTSFKKIILTGQLCLLAMAVCVIYMILGTFLALHTSWDQLTACLAVTCVTFFLNREGYFTAARLLLVTTINLTVFALCLVEPFESGLYTFYLICGLGAITIFGYEERGKATFFICFSAALFIASMALTFNAVPSSEYTQEYMRVNIIVNFSSSLAATILIVFFLINVNYHTETALRTNEQQIQQKNQELVKLNTELDRFVYSTSHDLRAPVSSIQGLIQLTRMTQDPAEVRKYIDIMQDRLGNLTKFIGDISDYARNARVDLKLKLLDVAAVVKEILENLKFYPGAEKIKVKTEVPDTFKIVTDPIRLQIILSNLITNAFKYADHRRGGCCVEIYGRIENENAVFVIKDNGVGIHEKFHDRIFDMFFQATDKSEGSGLGLYIVKESVEKMTGTIKVESSIGNGATFTVVLPTLPPAENVAATAAPLRDAQPM